MVALETNKEWGNYVVKYIYIRRSQVEDQNRLPNQAVSTALQQEVVYSNEPADYDQLTLTSGVSMGW